MQLLNNLFRITDSESADATTSRYRIELCSDSPIYKAHFPGMPALLLPNEGPWARCFACLGLLFSYL